MKIISEPLNIVFDGRGYGLINCIVTHRPTLTAATITIYGIDANGDELTLVNAQELKTYINESDVVMDVIPLRLDPLMIVWYEIDGSERMKELISVQFTSALPAEVEVNT